MSKSNLEQVDKMANKDIDYSDIPPLTNAQLAKMKPLREILPQAIPDKVCITIRLDVDTVQWFRKQVQRSSGGSYQNLINNALRDYVEQQNEPL